jgi:hypothetical protein
MKKEASRCILEMRLTSSEGCLLYHELFYEMARHRFCSKYMLEEATDEERAKLEAAMKRS